MNVILIALSIVITVVAIFRWGYVIGHTSGYEEGSRDVLRLYMRTRSQRVTHTDFDEDGWTFDEN